MAFLATPTHRINSIDTLASQVFEVSTQISSYLSRNNHAHPNFGPTSPTVPDTYVYENLRNQLNDAAHDLIRLVNGPKNILRSLTFSHTDLAAAQVALRFKFFYHVPDNNIGLTPADLARVTNIDEDRISRILKMLATHRIFEEVDGKFRHTATSAFLKTSVFASMAEASLDHFFKATSEMDNWIEGSPYYMGLQNSAFSKRFGTTFYEHNEAEPKKAERFSKAMIGWSLSKCSCYGSDLLLSRT